MKFFFPKSIECVHSRYKLISTDTFLFGFISNSDETAISVRLRRQTLTIDRIVNPNSCMQSIQIVFECHLWL